MKKAFNIFNHIEKTEKPTVDSAYFESLQKEVLAKIDDAEKDVSMFKKPSFWFGLASAACIGFVILFSSTPMSNKYVKGSSAQLNMEQISTAEVEEYLAENLDVFEEELIAEVFEIDPEIEIKESELESIDAEALEVYLEEYFIEENNNKNS